MNFSGSASDSRIVGLTQRRVFRYVIKDMACDAFVQPYGTGV